MPLCLYAPMLLSSYAPSDLRLSTVRPLTFSLFDKLKGGVIQNVVFSWSCISDVQGWRRRSQTQRSNSEAEADRLGSPGT